MHIKPVAGCRLATQPRSRWAPSLPPAFAQGHLALKSITCVVPSPAARPTSSGTVSKKPGTPACGRKQSPGAAVLSAALPSPVEAGRLHAVRRHHQHHAINAASTGTCP